MADMEFVSVQPRRGPHEAKMGVTKLTTRIVRYELLGLSGHKSGKGRRETETRREQLPLLLFHFRYCYCVIAVDCVLCNDELWDCVVDIQTRLLL